MSKKWKTRLGVMSMLSCIPLVILFKLNYISEGEGLIILLVIIILSVVFLKDYVQDLDKYNNLSK